MKSDGLSYFPLDVGFFKDDKIRRLSARFGADGPLFYIYVLSRAYENGYYVEYDEDFIEDAAIYIGCGPDKIRLILDYLLSRSLLISISLSTVKAGSQSNRGANKSTVPITVPNEDRSCGQIIVLTSHGIQMQYQASIKGRKRDVAVSETLWILNENETEGFIKVRTCENKSGNYPINPGNKTINPGNIRKVNKSKVNNISPEISGEIPGEQKIERTAPTFEHESKAYLLASWLDKEIADRLPHYKQKTEKALQKWAAEFDKIHRLDGIEWNAIRDVLVFSQDDSFWQTVILSPANFRTNFSKLDAKMAAEEKRHG